MNTKPKSSAMNWFQSRSRIFYLRLCVTGSLLVVAAVVGTMTFTTLSNSEKKLAEEQYDAISESALRTMFTSFSRMNSGTLTLAKAIGYAETDRDVWPNFVLDGFYDTVPSLASVSSLSSLVYGPVVKPDKLASFNEFMLDYFDNDPNIPPNAATTPYGRGAWGLNLTSPGVYLVTPDTKPYFDSPYNHSIPTIQLVLSETATFDQLGLSGREDPLFGIHMDGVFTCGTNANKTYARENCGVIGNAYTLPPISPTNPNPVVTGIGSFIFHPVILEDSSQTEPVGLIYGNFDWATLLESAVPEFVSGLDAVIEGSNGIQFTYRFVDGVPEFQGLGDLHDSGYDSYKYARSTNGVNINFVSGSVVYTVSLYPSDVFFEEYFTPNPLYLTIGSVVLIIFCSLIFVLYDQAVSHESTKKELVLDTKRRFVRFISHEIRTPMNTVKLGLKLFELELGALADQLAAKSVSAEETVSTLGETVTNWIQLTNDVVSSSEAAVDVLNDLLNYDKIEMGTLRLEFSSIPIWQLVKKTAAGFVMQAKQKEIEYVTYGDAWAEGVADGKLSVYEELHVVGDSGRISQILRNLLTNALKFTPEKGRVTVGVEWMESGLPVAEIEIPADHEELIQDPRSGSISISVTDTGAGLSEEQLGEICSEGVQFNANQLQAGQGSGLGLFISKGLAEQHGGTLSVSSEGLGQGATFTLELPLFRVPPDLMSFRRSMSESHSGRLAADGPALTVTTTTTMTSSHSNELPSQDEHCTGQQVPAEENDDKVVAAVSAGETMSASEPRRPHAKKGHRILVVDDALSNRKLLMRILKTKGYICEGAEDGQKAIEAYTAAVERNEPFSAILSDFEMPVMNGPEAVQKIRELGCECFIVGITGNVMQQDVDYFKDHGANVVLRKPLDVDIFESIFQKFRPGQRDSRRGGASAGASSTSSTAGASSRMGKSIDAPVSSSAAAPEKKSNAAMYESYGMYRGIDTQVYPISEV